MIVQVPVKFRLSSHSKNIGPLNAILIKLHVHYHESLIASR